MRERLIHGSAFWAWRLGAALAQRLPESVSYPAAVLGGEIAYLFSSRDMRVRLRDLKPEPLLKSLSHARSLFDREVTRRRMTKAEMSRALGRRCVPLKNMCSAKWAMPRFEAFSYRDPAASIT